MHQVTTMLATSTDVLFPVHNHPANYLKVITTLLSIDTDDPSLAGARVIIKVSGNQY